MNDVSRDLGKHDAEITQLKNDMVAVKSDVHKILLLLSEAKGGYRALIMVASISSAVGAITVKFLAWLMEK